MERESRVPLGISAERSGGGRRACGDQIPHPLFNKGGIRQGFGSDRRPCRSILIARSGWWDRPPACLFGMTGKPAPDADPGMQVLLKPIPHPQPPLQGWRGGFCTALVGAHGSAPSCSPFFKGGYRGIFAFVATGCGGFSSCLGWLMFSILNFLSRALGQLQ